MQNKLWRLAASVTVVAAVMSLAGCSTVTGMTDKVSQTWDKTWTGITSLTGKGKAQTADTPVATQAPQKAQASLPSGLKPSKESGRWLGLYSMDGEAGRFQECTTGQIIPVLLEGDNVMLEQAYLNTRSNASATMLAEVKGRVVEGPVADPVLAQQGRKMLALRVDSFVTLSSKSMCPEASARK